MRNAMERTGAHAHRAILVRAMLNRTEDAVVENLFVGVTEVFLPASTMDGLLGGDFLERFTLTLERATRQLWLVTAPTAP